LVDYSFSINYSAAPLSPAFGEGGTKGEGMRQVTPLGATPASFSFHYKEKEARTRQQREGGNYGRGQSNQEERRIKKAPGAKKFN
jgi:hypothetical protein